MSTQVPDLANPWRLVQFNKSFAGTVKADAFPRLVKAVAEVVADIDYQLSFGRDVEGRAGINGRVRTEVLLECRYCLKPVKIKLDSPLRLTLVATDAEAEQLAEEMDVVVLADGPTRLLELLEDEALLSLPAFPSHDADTCAMDGQSESADTDSGPQLDSANPFAALGALRKD